MTESISSKFRSRKFRLHPIANAAPLFFVFAQLLSIRVCGAEAADAYGALYDVIMTRHAQDGNSYAEDESSPTIFSTSDFPYGDKTYPEFSAALDGFAALSQSEIEAHIEIKRALLQRHLWKIFDRSHGRTDHQQRRAALQPKIASLMQRLALTRAQIEALPDTAAATAASGDFARNHDPTDMFKPFFPADLNSGEGPWICLGADDRDIPASIHTQDANWRSMFLTFMRLPGGRAATLNYIESVQKREEVFPVGTQFALVEQAFLISDEGELTLSPLIVSISLRAYLDVERKFSKLSKNRFQEPTQCVAEFVMQPRELMQGNAVMKAMKPGEHRFETAEGLFCLTRKDPFESGSMPRRTRLSSCMACHSREGLSSVETVHFDPRYAGLVEIGNPEAISKATADSKRAAPTWQALQELWFADSQKQ